MWRTTTTRRRRFLEMKVQKIDALRPTTAAVSLLANNQRYPKCGFFESSPKRHHHGVQLHAHTHTLTHAHWHCSVQRRSKRTERAHSIQSNQRNQINLLRDDGIYNFDLVGFVYTRLLCAQTTPRLLDPGCCTGLLEFVYRCIARPVVSSSCKQTGRHTQSICRTMRGTAKGRGARRQRQGVYIYIGCATHKQCEIYYTPVSTFHTLFCY